MRSMVVGASLRLDALRFAPNPLLANSRRGA